MESEQVDDFEPRSPTSDCADEECEKVNNDGHLRGCADGDGWREHEDGDLDIPDFLRRVA